MKGQVPPHVTPKSRVNCQLCSCCSKLPAGKPRTSKGVYRLLGTWARARISSLCAQILGLKMVMYVSHATT